MSRHLPVLLCAAVLAGAMPVHAQTPRPERPYRGVYANPGQRSVPVLTWHTSLGLGYDDNVLEGDGTLLPGESTGRQRAPSAFWGGSSSLRYRTQRDRLSLNALGSMEYSYYGNLEARSVPRYGATLDAVIELSSSTRLSIGEQLGYQPLYFLPGLERLPAPQLGEVPLEDASLGARVANRWTTLTGLGLVQQVSPRVDLELGASYQLTESVQQAPGLERTSGSLALRVGLNRDVGARIGVSTSESTYSGEFGTDRYRSSDLIAGLDFNRPLSLSRRTTMTFGTGVSTIAARGATRYFVLGHVALSHETGRSWTSEVSFRRDVAFEDVFRAPVFSDRVSLGLAGMPSSIVRLAASVGASAGRIGTAAEAAGYRNYYGTSDVIVALSRHVGIGASYTYYRYRFDDGVPLAGAWPRRTDRQRLSLYLSLWVPIATTNRSDDASR